MSGHTLLVSARLVTMHKPVRIELVAERPVAEIIRELALQRLRVVAPAQEAKPRQAELILPVVEDLAAEFKVSFFDVLGAHADRERRGDDRAGAGPADQIEVIAEHEIGAGRDAGAGSLRCV